MSRLIDCNSFEDFEKAFKNLGYKATYRDGNRYMDFYKDFSNSDVEVSGGEELQIGRKIVLCGGEITSTPYMKRGYMWSGSAVTFSRKGNVYAYGKDRIIGEYNLTVFKIDE